MRQLVEDVSERCQYLHGRLQVVEAVAPADHRLELPRKILHAQELKSGARRRAHEAFHLVLVHQAVEVGGRLAEARPEAFGTGLHRHVAIVFEIVRTHHTRVFCKLVLPVHVDRPLSDLVRHHRKTGLAVNILIVPIRGGSESPAHHAHFRVPVRRGVVVAWGYLPGRGGQVQAARIERPAVVHPLAHDLEVAAAEFVADAERDEGRRVAAFFKDVAQLVLDKSVDGLAEAHLVGRRVPAVHPDARLNDAEHAQFVRRVERGLGRRPGVEADRVDAVLVAQLAERRAPPFHGGLRRARERKVAAVEVAAHEPLEAVDPDRVVVRGHAAESKAYRMRVISLGVVQHERIEIRVVFRPRLGLVFKKEFDKVETPAVGRWWFDASYTHAIAIRRHGVCMKQAYVPIEILRLERLRHFNDQSMVCGP